MTNILNNLPQQKQEKRKNTAITVIVSILIVSFIILVISTSITVADTDSKQIADYEYQMNELRKAKEQCFDDLTRAETQDYLNWFTKPCVQYDEEIMELREKADSLKAKSYELGFTMNR